MVPEAVASNYTVVTSDKAKLISMGGSSFYTLTVNAASLYASNFAILAHNVDGGRGKVVAATGRTSFILWPHQSVLIYNDANVWKFSPDTQRWKTQAGITLFVDSTNGNDGNDGLAAGAGNAVQTISQAVNTIAQNQLDLDVNTSPQVTVKLADGSYPGLHFPGPLVGSSGNAAILLTGNTLSPANTVITGLNGGGCISLFDGAVLEVSYVKIEDATSAIGITVNTGGTCRLEGGVIFGSLAAGGAHIFPSGGGQIFADVGYSISANPATGNGYHALIQDGGAFNAQGQTISVTNNLAFLNTFAAARLARVNIGGATFSTGTFSVTGARYVASDLSMISTFGAGTLFIPGNAPGTLTVGSQYS